MIEIDFGGSPVKTNYRNVGNASFQYLFRGLAGAVRGSEDLHHPLELWRLHGNDAPFPETDPRLKRCPAQDYYRHLSLIIFHVF